MNSTLPLFLKDHFVYFFVFVSSLAAPGFYNLYRAYKRYNDMKIGKTTQEERLELWQQTKWPLRIAKIPLLVSFFLFILLCSLGLLLRVQKEYILIFLLATVIVTAITAIALALLMKN